MDWGASLCAMDLPNWRVYTHVALFKFLPGGVNTFNPVTVEVFTLLFQAGAKSLFLICELPLQNYS